MNLRLPALLSLLVLLSPLAATAQEWELHMKPKPGQQTPAQKPAPAPQPQTPPPSSQGGGWDLHMKPKSAAPSAEARPDAGSPQALAAFLQDSVWDGALFMRGKQPVRLSMAFHAPQGIAGALLGIAIRGAAWSGDQSYYGFTLRPDGDLRIARVGSNDDRSSPTWFATILRQHYVDAFDRTVLRVGMADGYAFLTRRTDTDPRTGALAMAERCAPHDRWLGDRLAAWELARSLKIEFADGLRGLDPARASLAAALDDAGFAARFGTGLDGFDEAGFRRLMLSFYDCALSLPELPRAELLSGLVDARLVTQQRGNFFADSGNRPALPAQPLLTLAQARDIARTTHQTEQELPALVDRAGDEAGLAPLAERLSQARPATLQAALAELKTRTDANRKDAGERRAAERQRRAADRMKGVRFPDGAIAPLRAPLMRQLVAGRVDRLQGEELAYVGGFAELAATQCGLPESAADRLTLLALIDPARQRAAGGSDYSNPNPGGAVGSAARSQAAYLDGAATAKAIGCRDPFVGAALASMVELASDMKRDAQGTASLFERSCRLDRSASDCACILQVGQATMPDIADRRYSRGLVGDLIQSNPFTGFKLAACGVTRY